MNMRMIMYKCVSFVIMPSFISKKSHAIVLCQLTIKTNVININ